MRRRKRGLHREDSLVLRFCCFTIAGPVRLDGVRPQTVHRHSIGYVGIALFDSRLQSQNRFNQRSRILRNLIDQRRMIARQKRCNGHECACGSLRQRYTDRRYETCKIDNGVRVVRGEALDSSIVGAGVDQHHVNTLFVQ